MDFKFCDYMSCEKLSYNKLGKYKCLSTVFDCIYSAKFYVYYLNKKNKGDIMEAYKCDLCGKYYDEDRKQYFRLWQPNKKNKDRNITWDERNKEFEIGIAITDKNGNPLNVCKDCVCQTLKDQFIVDWENE